MSRNTRGPRGWSVVLPVVLAACGSEEPADATGGGAVTDSAGVTLVESTRPGWGPGEAWTVAPEPVLSVGAGDPAFERIVGIVRLDDGRLVVLDAVSGRLLWLDADGTAVAEAGGRGEGPDEFAAPAGLVPLPADTVFVWDAGSRSLVGYLDGERTGRIEVPEYTGGSLRTPLALGDGSLVVPGRTGLLDRPLESDGRTRLEAPVLTWNRTGDAFDTLALVLSDEIMTMRIGGRSALGAPPFAKLTTFATHGDRLFVGDGAARIGDDGRGWMQVDVYDGAGSLQARYRAPAPRGRVEAADRESYMRILEGMARTSQDVQMLPALRTSIVYPERHPAYGELRVDDGGFVWLRTGPVTPPAPPAGPWTVLSPEGRLLGSVEVPAGFELRLVDGDQLVGVWRDDVGVEHLRVHRLVRR